MNKTIWESAIIRASSSQARTIKNQKSRFNSSLSRTQDKKKFESIEKHSKTFVFETQKAQNRLEPSTEVSFNLKTFDGPELTDRLCTLDEKPCLENYVNEEGRVGKEDKSKFVIHTFARPKRLVAIKVKQNREMWNKPATPSPTVRLGMAGWKLVKPRSVSRAGEVKERVRIRNQFLEIVSMRISDKK